MLDLVLGILLLASLLFNIRLLGNQKEPEKLYHVESVVDGDTFRLPDGQRVRLNGIDAPEKNTCFYEESKKALEKKILGKDVQIRDKFTDYFTRYIGNIFLGDRFINEEMIKEGFARPSYETATHKQEFLDAYGYARKNKLGLGAGICVSFKPIDPKCPVKANVSRDDRTRYYYVPSCKSYTSVRVDTSSEDKWFCSESEAKAAGFVKAPTCL